MSVQIFLEGKLLGIDEFLLAPAGGNPDQVFLGRSHWISLLSEVLPRALLAAASEIASLSGGARRHLHEVVSQRPRSASPMA